MLTFALRNLFVLLLLPVIASASQPPSLPVSLSWVRSEAIEGTSNRWYRVGFELKPEDASRFTATLASDATCTLYVNGQRVLKHETFDVNGGEIKAKSFDVTELIRSGRNLVAVEISSTAATAWCGFELASVAGGNAMPPLKGNWKHSIARPPVGWQQTDFNDRDWAEVSAAPDDQLPTYSIVRSSELKDAVRPPATDRTVFHFVDGDHVVLLGSTFFEREQQFGHLEAALVGTLGDRRVTFRNLGWDADTVFAESRGIFDAPAQGYLRMIEHVRAEEPSVIIVCYGQNDALTSGRTTEAFQTQYRKLLDDLQTTGASIVLMSPHPLFPAPKPLPSPARFNQKIAGFAAVVQKIAEERRFPFVDMMTGFEEALTTHDWNLEAKFSGLTPDRKEHPELWNAAVSRWTENGIHFQDRGYRVAGLETRNRLLPQTAGAASVVIDPASKNVMTRFAEVRNVVWGDAASKSLEFEVKVAALSAFPSTLVIRGIDANGIRVKVQDCDQHIEPTNHQFENTAPNEVKFLIPAGVQYDQLVRTIIRKNELYFHRWRPQNITYLFGFRKHEQGNNAVEIAQFDPFIQKLEAEIHQLQKPQWRQIKVTLP
ncbi:MAG: hypothetical protein JNL58_26055 [Planctomyces sp.]|nr:hypothetical protein [Planctomyces sp.]